MSYNWGKGRNTRERAWFQVNRQIRLQVMGPARCQVWDQVRGPVSEQVKDQVFTHMYRN